MSQVVMHSLKHPGVVPLLVKVQRLQGRLLQHEAVFEQAWNWIDAYLRLTPESEGGEPRYRMLREALKARRLLILLDGLDEGGVARQRIEHHVAEVLAPQGHVLLVTSRPAGIDEELFDSFIRLRLLPLTNQQQVQVAEQRLGKERAASLIPYIEHAVPFDTETKEKVSSNPLMLSMIISIFHLRQTARGTNEEMPKQVYKLYEEASAAMLGRAGDRSDATDNPDGVDAETITQLVETTFFQAHVAQRRIIDESHLELAALELADEKQLSLIRKTLDPWPQYRGHVQVSHFVKLVKATPPMKAGDAGFVTELFGLRSGSTKEGPGPANKATVRTLDGLHTMSVPLHNLISSGLTQDEVQSRHRQSIAKALEALADSKWIHAANLLRSRVRQDRLPLLSLLTAEPLTMQSSHLSFQEFYAARAIRKGQHLSRDVLPWVWQAWWANCLRLGQEMGDDFYQGLCRAAQVHPRAFLMAAYHYGPTGLLPALLANVAADAAAAAGAAACAPASVAAATSPPTCPSARSP